MSKSLIRNIPGLLLIFLGVGFAFDVLDIVGFSALVSTWWPLTLILIGILSFASNPTVPLWPLIIIGAGVLFQLNALDVLDFNFWNLVWPAILIGIGISLLPISIGKRRKREVSKDSLDISATFSGIEMKNASESFKGGNVSVLFGGVDIDLRDSKINDEAVLEVFVAFGGIGLKVPEDWNIQVSTVPFFGGVENKTDKIAKKDAPTLRIKGTCLFGGLEIKN